MPEWWDKKNTAALKIIGRPFPLQSKGYFLFFSKLLRFFLLWYSLYHHQTILPVLLICMMTWSSEIINKDLSIYGVWIIWQCCTQTCHIYLVKINIYFIFSRKCRYCRSKRETSEHYTIRNDGICLFFKKKLFFQFKMLKSLFFLFFFTLEE